MAKKPFNFDEHWASVIYRASRGKVDYIGASVRRKYDEDDIERYGPNTLIGLQTVEVHKKITDTDPESETFNKRINDPDSQVVKTRTTFVTKFTPEEVKKYKKLGGTTNMGETRYVYLFREHAYEAPDVDEFWTSKMSDVYDKVVKNRVNINLKQGTNVEEADST
jgi:hypothetical protein